MINKQYLLGLVQFSKFTPKQLLALANTYNDARKIFNLCAEELSAHGIQKRLALEYIQFRKTLSIQALTDCLADENIDFCTIFDKEYPELLKQTADPPVLLFYQGNPQSDGRFGIAFVGSRKNTPYGSRAVQLLVQGLPPEQCLVISGLALGIDACAHQSAVRCGIPTVGVIGSGLDKRCFYPAANKKLKESMLAAGGAVFSEYPPGIPPLKINFPARNRIIAGLARLVAVIEAGKRSGSLITARFALEIGRDVYALPHNIFSPLAAGCNELIKRGAFPVTCPDDLLLPYGLSAEQHTIKSAPAKTLSDDEKKIMSGLSHEPRHINDLVRRAELDTSKIISTLTIMEMKGLIKNVGNMEYIKI